MTLLMVYCHVALMTQGLAASFEEGYWQMLTAEEACPARAGIADSGLGCGC